jgi:hypothetical protein
VSHYLLLGILAVLRKLTHLTHQESALWLVRDQTWLLPLLIELLDKAMFDDDVIFIQSIELSTLFLHIIHAFLNAFLLQSIMIVSLRRPRRVILSLTCNHELLIIVVV